MGFFRSKMFKLAKSISPDTLLFLNDYGIIMDKYFEQIIDKYFKQIMDKYF